MEVGGDGSVEAGLSVAAEVMHFWHNHLEAERPGTSWWAAVHPMNVRSIRLLQRLGYVEVDPADSPPLRSCEPGDRCFSWAVPAAEIPGNTRAV